MSLDTLKLIDSDNLTLEKQRMLYKVKSQVIQKIEKLIRINLRNDLKEN